MAVWSRLLIPLESFTMRWAGSWTPVGGMTYMARTLRLSSWALGLVGVILVAPGMAYAQAEMTPTYTKDVAPIFRAKCEACHRPGYIAPMSLQSYADSRPWARSIKNRVETRQMPPWHIDPSVGIQDFQNDRSLTRDEIDTIVQWVDAGAPAGDPADMPPQPDLAEGGAWHLEAEFGRPPDFIVRSPPYDVVDNGQDQWWQPTVPVAGLDEGRWIRAYEFKPAWPLGLRVVHHGHAYLDVEGQDVGIAHYGVGKRYETLVTPKRNMPRLSTTRHKP